MNFKTLEMEEHAQLTKMSLRWTLDFNTKFYCKKKTWEL